MTKITLERWEADEFIVCVDDKPMGGTVTKSSGECIVNWLNVSYNELVKGRINE